MGRKKRAIKNCSLICVELPMEVLRSLELVPRPKAALKTVRISLRVANRAYGVSSKGNQRTLAAVFRLAN